MNLKYASIFGISLIITYELFLIFLGGHQHYSTVFSDIVSPATNLGVVILLFFAAKSSRKYGQHIYVAWIFLAVAQLSYFMGDVIWGVLEIGFNQQSSIADVFYLLYYPLFAAGILLLSRNAMKRDKQFKMFVDMGIVITSITLIFLTLLILPLIETTDLISSEFAVSLAYVIFDFLVLVVLINLLFKLYNKSNQTALFLLIIGLFFQIITDSIYMNLTLYGEYVAGSLIDIGWVIGYVFTGLAALSQIKEQKVDFNKYIPDLSHYIKFRYRSYVPSIFAAISYITLIWSLSNLEQKYVYLLELGVGIIIFLVILRQLLTLNENKRLFLASKDEIYKRRMTEQALKESEKKYRQIVENVDEGILSTDPEGKITFINPKIVKMMEYNEDELIGRHIFSLMPQNSVDIAEKCLIDIKKGNRGYNELQLIKKNGELIYAYFRVSPIIDNGTYGGCLALILDITERKKSEKEIKNSLIEKETLLREVHHRVKNNMQIISSLLSLQSRYINDNEALEIFQEGQNRVKSMALVHEKLYKSENLSNISIQDYIKDIIHYLSNAYNFNSIEFNINVQDISFNIDTAIPLGLIINEIITNSLKYAFPTSDCEPAINKFTDPATPGFGPVDNKFADSVANHHGSSKLFKDHKAEIETKLEKKDGKYIMTIRDNGIGLPEDFDIKNVDTLGLKLVNILVEQLEGSVEIISNNGTTFKINFNEIHN